MNADAPILRTRRATWTCASLGIGLLSSHTRRREAAEALLRQRYEFADASEAETLVALGGDGFMLQTLHPMLEGGSPAGRCSG